MFGKVLNMSLYLAINDLSIIAMMDERITYYTYYKQLKETAAIHTKSYYVKFDFRANFSKLCFDFLLILCFFGFDF